MVIIEFTAYSNLESLEPFVLRLIIITNIIIIIIMQPPSMAHCYSLTGLSFLLIQSSASSSCPLENDKLIWKLWLFFIPLSCPCPLFLPSRRGGIAFINSIVAATATEWDRDDFVPGNRVGPAAANEWWQCLLFSRATSISMGPLVNSAAAAADKLNDWTA